jgi:hypothetical protein
MVENMKEETVGSWKLMEKCLDVDLKVSRKMVLIVLCSHYPNIYPGEARIAKEAGIGLTAAKRAIKHLDREGWIKRQPRYSKTTVYTVNVARIMATPPRRLRIPAVEGGLLFPDQEADGTPQPPESAGIRPSVPPPQTAGIRPSEPAQTAGIRPIDSRNPATNRQDNIQVLTDNKNEPEKASRQKYTKDIESTNHTSKELENKLRELNAGMEIESNDLASSGDLTVDAQSALRPNCASSRPEVGGVQDHADSEEATVTGLPAPSPTSPSTPSPVSEHEKKDKASSAPASSASKPPALSLPANWQVAQEPTGRWVVNEVSADGKSSMPIGFGRTKEAAIADARATVKGAANLLAKWNKADPWE